MVVVFQIKEGQSWEGEEEQKEGERSEQKELRMRKIESAPEKERDSRVGRREVGSGKRREDVDTRPGDTVLRSDSSSGQVKKEKNKYRILAHILGNLEKWP